MGNEIGRFGISIGADLTDFQKACSQVESALAPLQGALNKLGGSLSNSVSAPMAEVGNTINNQLTPATRNISRATDDFTSLIRSQRQEQRLQTFAFNEAREGINVLMISMMALSGSLGMTKDKQQEFNKSLMEGFASFHATSFALQAAGLATGNFATIIGLVVGAGISLISFLSNTTDKLKEQRDALDKMTDAFSRWEDKLNGLASDNVKVSKEEADAWTHKVSVLQQMQDVMAASNLTDAQKIILLQQGIDIFDKSTSSLKKLYLAYLTQNDAELKELKTSDAVNDALTEATKQRDAAVASVNALTVAGVQEKSNAEDILALWDQHAESLGVMTAHYKQFGDLRSFLNSQLSADITLWDNLTKLGIDPADKAFVKLGGDIKKLQEMLGLPTGDAKKLEEALANLAAPMNKLGTVDIPKLGYSWKKEKEEEERAWRESHQVEMGLIKSLGAGFNAMFDQFLIVHRQAKNAWDAIWIAMENSAISSLAAIAVQALENLIVSQATEAAAAAATVATMATIAAAAAPAATLVSIASFGGAAAAGLASVLSAMATVQAVAMLPHLAKGGMVFGPTLALIGDNPGASSNPEVVAPLSDLKREMGGAGGGTVKHIVEGRIRGHDIYLVEKDYVDNYLKRLGG